MPVRRIDARGIYGELLPEGNVTCSAGKNGKKSYYFASADDPRYGKLATPRDIPVITAWNATKKLIDKMAKYSDSHGWAGIGMAEFDSKGRGAAINWDLYGYGKDYHDKRFLAVIQVREWAKRYKNGWASIHKNYYLIGTNEDGTVFAHPVPSGVVRSAIRLGKNVVLSVQTWMFERDYRKIIRQGDLGFYQVRKVMGDPIGGGISIMESHHVYGSIFKYGQRNYVINPVVTHATHDKLDLKGSYAVYPARRADYWDFAIPTAD